MCQLLNRKTSEGLKGVRAAIRTLDLPRQNTPTFAVVIAPGL